MEISEIKEELNKMYPNKQVKKLNRKNQFLFRCLTKKAHEQGTNWEDLLWEWGYSTDPHSSEEKEVIRLLNKFYPNKIVIDLKNKNEYAYNYIVKLSKLQKTTIEKKLTHWGFKYFNGTLEEYLKSELMKEFPDKNTESISIKNKKLYNDIVKYAKMKGYNWRKLLHEWGYKTSSERDHYDDLRLKILLEEKYPDKEVDKIYLNGKLYEALKRSALKENITIEKKLNNLGFLKKTNKNNNIEEESMIKLRKELLKIYPDKKINKIYKIGNKLYKDLISKADEEKTNWRELVKKLGFYFM